MIRLFVGLELPQNIRDRLLGIMGGIPGVRWQSEEQLHLTLRFIGEVEQHQAADIDSALSALHFAPFELSLESAGLFGTIKRPRILWAGVTPEQPVRDLARKIEVALVRTGLKDEQHKFSPHITVARCGRDASRITRYLKRSSDLTSAPWTVDRFTLFQSHLGHGGAHYVPLAQYPDGP